MNVFVLGASGRLGTLITHELEENNIAWQKLSRHDLKSQATFLKRISDFKKVIFIDVSLKEGTDSLSKCLLQIDNKKSSAQVLGLLTGVTDLLQRTEQNLESLSLKIPVARLDNFSDGVFLLENIFKAKTPLGITVIELIKALGYDVGIFEAHHKNKRDKPSGTAKHLQSILGLSQEKMASLRVGSIIGEHHVVMSRDCEELRISHIAYERRVFAIAAVTFLKKMWALNGKAGYYDKALLV